MPFTISVPAGIFVFSCKILSCQMETKVLDYNYDHHDTKLIRNPPLHCMCPPNKACQLDFKIDERMGEFLWISGLMKGEELKNYQKYMESEIHEKKIREKKLGRIGTNFLYKRECCCPS